MQSHYQRIGGEEKVLAMVTRFYDLMDELPEAWGIRRLHAVDLSGSRDKLFEFLMGWMGGPQLFVEKRGQPMLRKRHFPFPIGETERDQWLMCMRMALDDCVDEPKLREELYLAFAKVADHVRNEGVATQPTPLTRITNA